MPKFLDTVSYFDESGNENFIECGRQRIEISNTPHSINMATIAPGKYIFRVSSDCVSSGKLSLSFGSNTLSYSWSSIPYQLNYVAFDVYCYEEEMPVSKYFVFYNISIKPGSTNVVSNLLLSGTFAPEIGRKCSLISSVINASLLGTTNIISNDIGIGVNGSFSTPTLNRSIFAPTSAGTSGQFLKSKGGGSPTWESCYIHNITMQLFNKTGSASGFFVNVRVINNSTSVYNFSSLWEYINSYYAGINDAAVKCYPAIGVGWTGTNSNSGIISARTIYGLGVTTITATRYMTLCSGALEINNNSAPYIRGYFINDNQLFSASDITTINDVVISV